MMRSRGLKPSGNGRSARAHLALDAVVAAVVLVGRGVLVAQGAERIDLEVGRQFDAGVVDEVVQAVLGVARDQVQVRIAGDLLSTALLAAE
jgi:hypothetical protein